MNRNLRLEAKSSKKQISQFVLKNINRSMVLIETQVCYESKITFNASLEVGT